LPNVKAYFRSVLTDFFLTVELITDKSKINFAKQKQFLNQQIRKKYVLQQRITKMARFMLKREFFVFLET